MNWVYQLFSSNKDTKIAVLEMANRQLHERLDEAIADRNREMGRVSKLLERLDYLEQFEPIETREIKKALDARMYLADARAEHRAMKGGDDE